jgi:hypothetical protein
MGDALGEFTLVERVPSSYDGPVVAQCKKGRESEQQVTANQLDQMKVQQALQQQEQSRADAILNGMVISGKPGQLSPAAQAQYASDIDNINRTYNGMRQQAFSAMGQRGFGSAPSGMTQAAINAVNQGQAEAGTGAYRNAQINTQNLENTALNARMGLSGQNLSGSNAAANTASNSALAQSKMGSTLGDVASGIAAVAPLALAPLTGGASLGLPAGNFSNPFAKLFGGGNSNPNSPGHIATYGAS